MTGQDSSGRDEQTASSAHGWPAWLCAVIETAHATIDEAESAPALGTGLPATLTASTPVDFAWIGTVAGPAITVRSAPPESGLPSELAVDTLSETLTARAESTGDGQSVQHTTPDDVWMVAEHVRADPADAGAFVGLPLQAGEECYGVLHLWVPEPTVDDQPLASVGLAVGRRLCAFERAEQLARERTRLESLRSLVSHDLGNPVNIASGRVELARADEDISHLDSVDRALEEIDTLIERGVRLVEVGQQPLDRETLSLGALARDSWSDVGRERGELAVTDASVDGERERVRMLLNELVENAFVHSEGDITVEVGPLSGGEGFYVADDGPGIPPDEREYIVDAGYTTDSERDGIGLSVVTEIAGAHGWAISLTSKGASGARVEIVTGHW